MSNQYNAKLEQVAPGDGTFYKVSLWDGDEEVFSTSLIPARYKLVADMLHSTLEVAIAFGFLAKSVSENGD